MHAHLLEWPEATSDIASIPTSAEVVRLKSGAKPFKKLEEITSLKRLWCFDLDRKSLDCVADARSLEALYVETVRGTDLSPLSRLSRLTTLSVDSCSRETTAEWASRLQALNAFRIVNLKSLNDLSAIGTLSSLNALMISGGMWSKMKVRSFRPLGRLSGLKFLGLLSLRVDDGSLEPLQTLDNLVELSLAGNLASWDEYARLAAALPNTECHWFKPFVEFSAGTCDRCGQSDQVMFTGKRQPTLCRSCDVVKVDKLVERFEKISQSG